MKRSSWSIARLTFGGSLVRSDRFGDLRSSRKSTFGGSLVRNAHFGDAQYSCLKAVSNETLVETCAARFGDLRGLLLEEVSYETLTLETRSTHV